MVRAAQVATVFAVTAVLFLALADHAMAQSYDFQSAFGSRGSGPGQFLAPAGVAVDAAGRVIVADQGNHRVHVGSVTFGSLGAGPGQFAFPFGVAVDSGGRIIVSDHGIPNDRIQVFDSGGSFLFSIGTFGLGPGQFAAPLGVAVNASGQILVADSSNHRVQAFGPGGNFLFAFGSFGSGPGQFNDPRGIAVDSSGRILVVEVGNNRVQVFTAGGGFLFSFGGFGSGLGQFNFPNGIAIDPTSGRIVVADTNNHRIQVFDRAGNFLSTFGSGQLAQPFGLAVDPSGRILVADAGGVNNPIQVFAPQRARLLIPAASASPTAVRVGEPVTLQVAVQNTGTATANNVVPEVSVASGAATLISGPLPPAGAIGPSSSGVFTLTFRAGAEGTLRFSAGATGIDGGFGAAVSASAVLSSAVTVLPADTTPPGTTATASPGPNANGWNNANVTVTLSATDDPEGSGVKEVQFTLAGAQGGAGVVSGGVASVTITAEGITTLTYFARDNAGNQEPSKSLTVRIDKTPPVVTVSRSPAPNAFGWNNTDVTARFQATDTLSGILGASVVDVSFTLEGANQGASRTFTDLAGNSASAAVSGINIDKTPPSITGSRSPAPNAFGWNNTDVTVSFACSDEFSGIHRCGPTPQVVSTEGAGQARTATAVDLAGNSASATVSEISIDKTPPSLAVTRTPEPNVNGWNNTDVTVSFTAVDALSGVDTVSAPATLGAERAGQVVSGAATDRAGNTTAVSVTLNIDKTPPELAARCAPPGSIPVIFGRDGLSGVALVAPAESAPLHRGKFEERQTFAILDLAGNQLQAAFGVKAEGHEAEITLLSLAYNGHAAPALPENDLRCEWALERTTGAIKELEQKLEIGSEPELPGGHDETEVRAKFRAKRNETEIRIRTPESDQEVIRPGVVFLHLTTDRGDVGFGF